MPAFGTKRTSLRWPIMSGVGDKSLITHIRHDGRHGIHRTTNRCGRPSDLGGDANRLDETSLTHAKMGDELLGDGDSLSLIAEATDGIAVGFAEIAVRKYANGCDTRPVAFLEGVWVKPQFRRRGIGAGLIAHAEALLVARGFRELGSDTWIEDRTSQAAHLAWGFSETERVVYFRKILKLSRR